jgi:hypothetical protein
MMTDLTPSPAEVMAEIDELLPGQPADPPALLAGYIRAAASLLAQHDVAGTTAAREILYELGQGFGDLDGPLRVLFEAVADADDSLAAEFEGTRQALLHVARGVQRAAACL